MFPAFASITNGAIDGAYKYVWGENVGWINFGASNGNVHITDSELSGSALGENIGWIIFGGDYKVKTISNFPNFRDAGQEKYQTTKIWTLTEGEGIKTVYAKFFTDWGQASPVVSGQIQLKIIQILQRIIQLLQ